MQKPRQRKVETALIVGAGDSFGDQLITEMSRHYQGIIVMGLSQREQPELAENSQYKYVKTDLRKPEQHAANLVGSLAGMPPLSAVIFGAKPRSKKDIAKVSSSDLAEAFEIAVGGMQATYSAAANLLAHQRALSLRFLEINGNFAHNPDPTRAALSAALAARRNLALSWRMDGVASKSLIINGVVADGQIQPSRVVSAIIDHLHGPVVSFQQAVSRPGAR